MEDDCGNRDSCTQVITVRDTESPTIVCPPDTTVGCDTPIDSLSIFGGPQAMDNCTGVFIISDTLVDLNICNVGTITRIFTAVDSAGNTAQCEQVVTFALLDTLKESGIIWPDSIIEVDACVGVDPDSIPRGRPMIDSTSATCFLVSQMFTDSVDYNCVPGICTTLTRKWTLIDSCQLDTATGQGIFMFTQEIRVIDTMKPELEILVNGINTAPIFTDSIFLGPNNTNCDTFLSIIANADDCSGIRSITNNSQIGGNGMEDASGVYPRGIHPITFIVEDSCCNADTQLLVILVLDTIRPTIQCQDALMNLSGEFPMEMAEFCVSDLIAATMDNCDSRLDLTISFDPNDPSDTCRVYNCDSLNGNAVITRMLTLYVTDVSGNITTCVSEIVVRDPFNICGRTLVAGSVSNMIGLGIENTQVEITEMDIWEMTDENGLYSFPDMRNGLSYTLVASREDDDPTEGVTLVDIITLQRHLLGVDIFDNPYQYLAGDVNGNMRLDVSDMVRIRQMTLGRIKRFPQVPVWSFVDAEFEFDPNLHPREQVEAFSCHIEKLTEERRLDFIGVKAGDVNGDATVSSFGFVESRSSDKIDFEIHQQQSWRAGDQSVIVIESPNQLVSQGFHLHLQYDSKRVRINEVEIDNVESNLYNIVDDGEGYLQILWSDPLNVKALDRLSISLLVECLEDFRSQALTTSEFHPSVLVGEDMQVWSIDLAGASPEAQELTVEQNRPNPFGLNTIIPVYTPVNDHLILEVYNAGGQRVLFRSLQVEAGWTHFNISEEELGQAGMYVYKVIGQNGSVIKRMMMIQ